MQFCGFATCVHGVACIALSQSCSRYCLHVQEVLDLQLAVQMRDDHLAECQRQSDLDQQQIDDLERQLLMQVLTSSVL